MHDSIQWYGINSPFTPEMVRILAPIILIVVAWTIILKGISLWSAARASQKGWFIALLVVNTLGILEIIYLIWFRPAKSSKLPPRDSVDDAPVHTSSSAQ